MDLHSLLTNKQLKAKQKVEAISKMLVADKIKINDLIKVAKISNDSQKGTCIESIEFATRIQPAIVTSACFDFVTETLLDNAPRVKWESAKVIGNIAALFPNKLDNATRNLLVNTEYDGTVVRWSAAFALAEIIKLKTKQNKDLIPAIESIIKRENSNAIKKIYLAGLKKVVV